MCGKLSSTTHDESEMYRTVETKTPNRNCNEAGPSDITLWKLSACISVVLLMFGTPFSMTKMLYLLAEVVKALYSCDTQRKDRATGVNKGGIDIAIRCENVILISRYIV